MRLNIICSGALFFLLHFGFAQENFTVWNPQEDSPECIEGRAFEGTADLYNRLPARMQKDVRPPVWNFSRNSAGLQIRFRTNADQFVIRYGVAAKFERPHMTTLVSSGVDLYVKSPEGKWFWCGPKTTFGDTIVYRYQGVNVAGQNRDDLEYTLYFPLYNTVTWMEVAVPGTNYFVPLKARTCKPIVVYGTSVAQGACAPRPGLAWTSILSRLMDRPVINLGFSGNGELEAPIIDLISDVDAYIYILDCMGNMPPRKFTEQELKKRISGAVGELRRKRPTVPILMADHAGYEQEQTNDSIRELVEGRNRAFYEVFDSLGSATVVNLYRLPKQEIARTTETTVDGIHPNALGMMRYATAYEKKIREIFNISAGNGCSQSAHPEKRKVSGAD